MPAAISGGCLRSACLQGGSTSRGFTHTGVTEVANVERLDTSGELLSWQECTPLLAPRTSLAAACVGGARLYAIGGQAGSSTFASVEEFDLMTAQWRSIASMRSARKYCAAAALDGALLWHAHDLNAKAWHIPSCEQRCGDSHSGTVEVGLCAVCINVNASNMAQSSTSWFDGPALQLGLLNHEIMSIPDPLQAPDTVQHCREVVCGRRPQPCPHAAKFC